MKTLLITLAVALGTTVATPSSAEPVAASRVTVSTTGLDLSTERGVRALDLRILHAASAACGTPSSADPRGRIKFDQCRSDARTAAVAQRERILQAARGQGAVEIALTR